MQLREVLGYVQLNKQVTGPQKSSRGSSRFAISVVIQSLPQPLLKLCEEGSVAVGQPPVKGAFIISSTLLCSKCSQHFMCVTSMKANKT